MKKIFTLKNFGWALSFIVSLILLKSSINHLINFKEIALTLRQPDLTNYIFYLGFFELTTMGLLLYPKSILIGSIFTACILTNYFTLDIIVNQGQGAHFPVSGLVLLLFSYMLRTFEDESK